MLLDYGVRRLFVSLKVVSLNGRGCIIIKCNRVCYFPYARYDSFGHSLCLSQIQHLDYLTFLAYMYTFSKAYTGPNVHTRAN